MWASRQLIDHSTIPPFHRSIESRLPTTRAYYRPLQGPPYNLECSKLQIAIGSYLQSNCSSMVSILHIIISHTCSCYRDPIRKASSCYQRFQSLFCRTLDHINFEVAIDMGYFRHYEVATARLQKSVMV